MLVLLVTHWEKHIIRKLYSLPPPIYHDLRHQPVHGVVTRHVVVVVVVVVVLLLLQPIVVVVVVVVVV